jgi:hypothetical protein
MSYQSNNNAVLYNNCQYLQNLTVILKVTETISTVEGAGFSLQLDAYPPPGQYSQGQPLIIFQYIIYIQNNNLSYEVQYWSSGSTWPPGYSPVPGTSPWLPAWPNDYFLTQFGSAPGNQIPRDSELQISLTTDSNNNVTGAVFSYTDPNLNVSSKTFTLPQGALYPIVAFEVDLVGPGNSSNCTFVSGLTSSRGIFYYSVSPGTLSVQSGGPGAACGEWGGGTAETSNAVYSDVTPSSGSTVTQTLGQPVDCAVNSLVTKEAGSGASAMIGRLQQMRDSQFKKVASGQWVIEFLSRHAADIAGLLNDHPELCNQCYTLLAKAESAAAGNSVFSPQLINDAEAWLTRASGVARGSLQTSAASIQTILESLRGRTLQEGLQAASQIIRPRFPPSA